jgi:hypothetical protein
LVAKVRDAELFQQFFNAQFHLSAGKIPSQLQYGAEIVGNTQLAKNRWFLGQIAYSKTRPRMHGHVGDRTVVEKNIAFVRPDEPHNHVETGGFARTVRAKQTDDFPAVIFKETLLTTRRLL